MVGHAVIGVLFSSMKDSSLSSQARRSGESDISYSLAMFSPGCWEGKYHTVKCSLNQSLELMFTKTSLDLGRVKSMTILKVPNQ